MGNTKIHPSAIVSDKASIGSDVTIGAFSIVEDDVVIGNNVEIRSSVIIADGARIGNDCKFFSGAVISTEPQDLKFAGESTLAIIGDNTVVREYATVNRGTKETGRTQIGENCLIMAYAHVAHDCSLGNNVIMSNVVQLAGHVTIEDWVIMGGVAKIHQFCSIGQYAMVGADMYITKDVAPYTLIGRKPPQVEGINKVGLRRRGFSAETISAIQNFYDTILFSRYNTRDGIAKYKKQGPMVPEVERCIDFIEKSTRGIYR